MMRRGLFPACIPARAARAVLLALCCGLAAACAIPAFAANAQSADISRTGAFPKRGTIVIRSGLSWMNETAPAFQAVARELQRELASLGLTVAPYAKPSKLEAMPETPLPPNTANPSKAGEKMPPAPLKGAAALSPSDEIAREKTESLAKDGKLPQLKLRSYGTPRRDADLPQSVKNVRPPDVSRAMYARSQEQGLPVVHTFAVPGRIPEELESDAAYADYALVVRFASVRSWGAAPERFMNPSGPLAGTLVAAAGITGSGALGYGPPASPSSSAPPSTYGTPGGYVRGYEGSAPTDFWGRDRDFFQRDYQFKHGAPPQYATPPKGLSTPPRRGGPASPDFSTFGEIRTPSISEWILLHMDCYDLAPVRNGQKPTLIWSGSARKPAQGEPLANDAASLARAVFAANAARP